MTTVIKFVPATKTGPFSRLIGSLDFKGQGTKHPLEVLDPFVLCDDSGSIQGKGKPPFGLHPHYGLIAISSVLEGAFSDEDNINGLSGEFNEAGSVYAVSAGQGLCHSEVTQVDGPSRLIQTIVKIPQDKLEFHPEISKVKAADVPKIQLPGGYFSLLVGKLDIYQSPICLKAMPRFILGRLFVEPKTVCSLPMDSDLEHGFAYVLKGNGGKIAGENIVSDPGVYLFENSSGLLSVENSDSSSILELFVGAALKLNEPWVKLLGHNGFIIAENEEKAQSVMAKVDNAGVKNFNYKTL
ncbi:uncharacterized protein LOC131882295 [Tigriopus californicus]|uniref:uncharacterized protein LOC131882295 n=1 Tax=Tigriopus californicus TaxID=6832 RepID=UPI0027D9FE28|nr:uncharacterized protein LOC131882295 [Tigriopus californicus]|eukprot:TCALIF_09319-PA protein Name:"Similar to PIR Pirin (Homo sapiens)" AED:0.06 eAED:0.06 QI:301/1/1/1/1/1/4/129/296